MGPKVVMDPELVRQTGDVSYKFGEGESSSENSGIKSVEDAEMNPVAEVKKNPWLRTKGKGKGTSVLDLIDSGRSELKRSGNVNVSLERNSRGS